MYIVIRNTATVTGGEVYVLDTVAGHRATRDRIVAFLGSRDTSLLLTGQGKCPLLPDAEVLSAMRFVKTDGSIHTTRMPDGVVQVAGRPEYLQRYARDFHFDDGASGHRLPETAFNPSELHPRTEMIVIEAADELEDEDL